MGRIGKMAIVCALWLAAAPAGAGLKGVVQSFPAAGGMGSGIVDYDAGFVEATATGTADMRKMVNTPQAEMVARKTARHLAYEVMAEIVGKIQIDSKTLYQDAMLAMDALKTETHAVIRGAVIVKDELEWVRDRRTQEEIPMATVTLRKYLTGDEGLGSLIDKHLPPGGGYQPVAQPQRAAVVVLAQPPAVAVPVAAVPAVVAAAPAPAPVAEPAPAVAAPAAAIPAVPAAEKATLAAATAVAATPAVATQEGVERYSSLVIDTTTVAPGYRPAYRVYVKDEADAEVYGPGVPRASVRREGRGLVRYAADLERAQGLFESEGKPLVVKAVAVPAAGEVIISEDSARAIAQANLGNQFLDEARVVMLLGE